MKVAAVLTLLVVNIHLSRSCYGEGSVLFCLQIQGFLPGYSSLVLIGDVGEINSTALRSDDLASITRLRIANAGVTGVAEGAFGSMGNLSSLSLEQNLLTEISPSWFSRPAVLRQLDLSENRIGGLNASMLNGFTGLSELYLNRNRITTIHPDCFSSQTNLAELDLSENRMTRFSPRVFESLNSTRMRLHGNPWDCSCDAEDFLMFLKDLQSRSLLEEEIQVTCYSPPPLSGRPVWNVSVCVTSQTPPVHQGPTDTPRTDLRSTATSSVTSPPSDTETSTHHKSCEPPGTDAAPPTITETHVTFPPRPPTRPNIVPVLTLVIVLLCVLLCVLALLHRRKRYSKTVMPTCQKEENVEVKEGSRSGHGSPRLPEIRDVTGDNRWDSEVGRTKRFAGVRAKSADALLFTSPHRVSGKNQETSQTETEASSKEPENPSEGTKTLGNGSEAAKNTTDADVGKKDGSVGMEPMPYLSIGTNRNKASPDDFSKGSADAPGQRSQMGKKMLRIGTWPPTAARWQGRCHMKEQGEERADESFRLKGEGGKWESPAFIDKQGVGVEQTERVTHVTRHPVLSNVSEGSKRQNDKTPESEAPESEAPESEALESEAQCAAERCSSSSVAHNHTDVRQEEQLKGGRIRGPVTELQKQNPEQPKPAGNLDPKIVSKSSSKGEARDESKTRENGHGAKNTSTGSKAASGGVSLEDESVFMDLLHEVVQNNGRWTRGTWRQVNKQRHNLQGQ